VDALQKGRYYWGSLARSGQRCGGKRRRCEHRESDSAEERVFDHDAAITPRTEVPSALLGEESVADARFGRDMARAGGVDFQLVTELSHVHPEVVGLVGVGRSPYVGK